MGFGFGKSSKAQVSGQSATQRHASNLLLEALIPGSSMTGGYVSQQGQAPVYATPQQLAAQQAAAQQTTAVRDPKWPTAVPDHVRVGPALQPGQNPQQYFYDSLRPGGDTPPQVPPGYTITSEGQVVPLPGQPASVAQTGVQTLAGTGDPIEQVVSNQVGNYVPSARQQGFGALAGHGMTEAYRQQVGPYTDVWGGGRVASYNPLTQTQTDAVTQTLLPSTQDMAYQTTFEKLANQTLPQQAADIVQEGGAVAADPLGKAMQAAQAIDDAILGGVSYELPELPQVTAYMDQVYTNMPEPMKNVVDDLLQGGLTENLVSSLETNVAAFKNIAEIQLNEMLDETYGRFAASGVSGGAMLAAAGDVTTKVMAELSGQIAGFYMQSYQQLNQERQMALNTVENLIGTAQQQQAMDFQANQINLETQLKIVEQKYNMYGALTTQFLDHNLAYMNIIAQEVDRQNTEQINTMRMFYEIMVSLATGGPALATSRSKSSQFQISTGARWNPFNPTDTTDEGDPVVERLGKIEPSFRRDDYTNDLFRDFLPKLDQNY
jgi:hypothetical protein